MTKWRPSITRHFVTLSHVTAVGLQFPVVILQDAAYSSGSHAFGSKRSRGQNGPQLKRARTVMVPAWGSRGGTTATVVRRELARQSAIERELKFKDTAIADTTLTASMVITNLNVLQQGDGQSERVGRKVIIKGLHIRGQYKLIAATAAADTSTRVRQRVVMDSQTNKAEFVATDLLVADSIDSFGKLANKGRFRVLSDEVYTLASSGAAPTGAAFAFGEDVVNVDINLTMTVPVEFNADLDTGVIATQVSNSLKLVTQCNDGEIINQAVNVRIRFLD